MQDLQYLLLYFHLISSKIQYIFSSLTVKQIDKLFIEQMIIIYMKRICKEEKLVVYLN